MKNILSFVSLIFYLSTQAQQVTLSGYIREEISEEAIVGARLMDSLSQKSVYSNEYGFFSLSVPKGEIRLLTTLTTFEPYRRTLNLSQDTLIYVDLRPQTLSAIEITDEALVQERAKMNQLQVSLQELKSVPLLLSEKDLLKALALTPGVSLGLEGTSGILVRGGSPDQNLILLDDATVYNASHLFGFVSIFNMDAIKHVELYKGGFPASYGGRLSSVVDIKMKEGNREKRENRISLGLISSHISMEGPLNEGNTSYFLSGRASYLSLIGLPIYLSYKAGASETYFNYWLYDLNAKINHTFKDKSQLYVSMYNGLDDYTGRERISNEGESKFGLNWGNRTHTIRYNRMLGKKAFLKGIASYSNYVYRISASESNTLSNADTTVEIFQKTNITSKVRDFTAKISLDLYPFSGTVIRTGIESISQRFQPGIIRMNDLDQEIETLPVETFPTQTYATYIDTESQLFSRLTMRTGLRASSFQLADTTISVIEPRFLLDIHLGTNWSLQTSYSIMRQNMNLLSSNGVGLPNDIWVPATSETGISRAEQLGIGVGLNLPQIPLALSVEAYHKSLRGLIEYKSGGGVLNSFNQNWQEQIETDGVGEVYGIETMIHKKSGSLSGWLAYTWSINRQRFSNINKGAWFRGRFDRRHDIALTGSYQIDKYWKLSASWVYTSGAPVTVPIGILQDYYGEERLIYTERNNSSFPAYHRLDFGAEFTVIPEDRNSPVWSINIYNVYNRQNPFSLLLEPQPGRSGEARRFAFVQRSLFPIIPSLSYSWSF